MNGWSTNSARTQAVTPTNSSLHYRRHSSLHHRFHSSLYYRRHVQSQLRCHCLHWQKAITCWDDDDEEHGNEIEAGGQLRLLLPNDLLSSSCRSNSNRPIVHSDMFFVVRSLVLLSVCSSSSVLLRF